MRSFKRYTWAAENGFTAEKCSNCGLVSISWLDIGAGYGEVVEAIHRIAPVDSRVLGIEPMAPKARDARRRGLDIRRCYLSDVTEKFEFVSLVNFFSHLPDFCEFLGQLRTAMSPNGELFLETGNIGDLQTSTQVPTELDLPDHLVFAGEDNIRQFLHDAGFEVVKSNEFERMVYLRSRKISSRNSSAGMSR